MKRQTLLKSFTAMLLAVSILLGAVLIGFAQDDGSDAAGEPAVSDEGNLLSAEESEDTDAPEAESGGSQDGKVGFSRTSPLMKITGNGLPTLSSSTFVKVYTLLRYIKYMVTGRILGGKPETLDVTVSDDVIAVCNAISEQSALDVYKLLVNVPDLNDPARIAKTVFQLDVTAYRNKMYEARKKYDLEGNVAMADLCWLIGAYMSVIEKVDIHLVPKDDYYEIELFVTYSDGEVETFHPEIYINPETGECFGPNDRGMMNIGFNCNAYEALVYAPMYCWMRDFGFCVEYDMLCYALPMYRYHTRRFKFDYDGREWMVQCWKGNYMITNGGEVGIYNRAAGSRGTYYNVVSDEERLDMSLQIRHGDEVLVNIPEQTHWWVNGFKLGYRMYNPHTLDMTFTIRFRDEEMMNAFTESIGKNFFHDVTYTVDGLLVTVEWDG